MMEATLPKNFAPDFRPLLRERHNDYRAGLPIERHDRCFVTHSGIALKRFRLIRETAYVGNIGPRVVPHFHRYALYKFFTGRRIRSDDPRLLLLHNHWGGGYYHWLTECLIKVPLVDPSRYVVLLPADFPQFAAESLALFPFAGTLRLPPGHGLSAKTVTVVGNPHPGRPNPEQLQQLKQDLLTRCRGTALGRERVYLTRRDALWRRVENEAEVVSTLERYGFDVVDPSRLSFCEQVGLFSGCRAMVSVHGAGLTNMMFMPEGGRVLELLRELESADAETNPAYWHLSTIGKLDYYYQFCQRGQNEGEGVNQVNVIVDIERLEQNIQLMLA